MPGAGNSPRPSKPPSMGWRPAFVDVLGRDLHRLAEYFLRIGLPQQDAEAMLTTGNAVGQLLVCPPADVVNTAAQLARSVGLDGIDWALERVLAARHATEADGLRQQAAAKAASQGEVAKAAVVPRQLDWRQLSVGQQAAASALGWTSLSWDCGCRPAASLMTRWIDLPQTSRHTAAGELGCTDKEWDSEIAAAAAAHAEQAAELVGLEAVYPLLAAEPGAVRALDHAVSETNDNELD